MILLSNQAKVLAVYLTVPDTGGRATGVVLAETASDFVTWNVWQGAEGALVYEADTGHYVTKRGEMERGEDRQRAELDYGKRLLRHITANMFMGIQDLDDE